jgi:flagellar biosynthesis/type III secretory pathway protein FliH
MPTSTPPSVPSANTADEMQQARDLQKEQTAAKENETEQNEAPTEEEEETNEENPNDAETANEESGEDAQEKARQKMAPSLAKTLLRIPKKTCSSIVGLVGTIIRIIFDVKAASMIYDAIDKIIGEENTDRAFCCALGCGYLTFLAILFAPVIIAALIVSKILSAIQ